MCSYIFITNIWSLQPAGDRSGGGGGSVKFKLYDNGRREKRAKTYIIFILQLLLFCVYMLNATVSNPASDTWYTSIKQNVNLRFCSVIELQAAYLMRCTTDLSSSVWFFQGECERSPLGYAAMPRAHRMKAIAWIALIWSRGIKTVLRQGTTTIVLFRNSSIRAPCSRDPALSCNHNDNASTTHGQCICNTNDRWLILISTYLLFEMLHAYEHMACKRIADSSYICICLLYL